MKQDKFRVIGTIILFIFVVALMTGLYKWTDRSMDYILTLVKETPSDFPNWASILITLVFNGALIVFNSIVEIIRIFL
jgi:hypothetical protein